RARRRFMSELEITRCRQIDAAADRDASGGRWNGRKHLARWTGRDESTIDENDTAIVQAERRHDVEADVALVNFVIDQDLMTAVERARRDDRAKARSGPIGDMLRQRRRRIGGRGVKLRAQRLFRVHPGALPI